MRRAHWLIFYALGLQLFVAMTYFLRFPFASAALGFSMLCTLGGFLWLDYELRKISFGESIPARRLPIGFYGVVKYFIFPNGDIAVLVWMADEKRVKYCILTNHELHAYYRVTMDEVVAGRMDFFEVAAREGGGKQIFLCRFPDTLPEVVEDE